jgi:hypothetical protein
MLPSVVACFSMPGPTEWLVIIAVLLIVLVGAVALFVGARIVRIQQPTFARALGCRMLTPFACLPVWFLLARAPVAGPVLGLASALPVDAVITWAIFRTTFSRALGADVLAWLFDGVCGVLLLTLLVAAGIMSVPGSGAGP